MQTHIDVRTELEQQAVTEKVSDLARFFKTGSGEYAEGDQFLGASVPTQRKIARRYRDLPRREITKLLDDPIHECRLTALLILVDQFERAGPADRKRIVRLYLSKLDRVNNWDLVDASAYKILGAFLADKDRGVLSSLADSGELWRQRVAVVATFHFIRAGDYADTLRLARKLLDHEHDLIHKAVGWMLREIGKRDRSVLERFLKRHYVRMPRTTLRYAVERFEAPTRRAYLDGRV